MYLRHFFLVLQSTALAMVEVSLELVHDFKNVVETLPENVDTSTTAEAPPILSCGDRSIANRAITMLQVIHEKNVTSLYMYT